VPSAGQLTPKGIRTRERIVQAASELVFAHGITATTLDEVKTAAGVGSSQLYHYFDGKADLIEAIVAHHTETIVARQEPILRELDTIEQLRSWAAFVVAMHRSFDCRGGCPIGSLGSELAELDETARQAISASLNRWQAALRDGLHRLRNLEVLSPAADPDALAQTLIVTLQGGLLLGKIHRSPQPLQIALSTAIDHVQSLAAPAKI
jgi:TetR/AcrR family transcriptional regulator, transcriptional repressor for nem operon